MDRLVTQVVLNKEPFLAGSVELLGLDHIKRELGDKWLRIGPGIKRIAESEIRRNLSSADHFKSDGETRFVMCFGALDRQRATDRAMLISRAIKARLLEEMPEIEEQASVDLFVAEVNPRDVVELEGERSLADRLSATLEKMQGEVELAAATQRRMIVKDSQLLFAPVWQVEKQVTCGNRAIMDTSLVRHGLEKMKALGDDMQVRKTVSELDCMTLTRAIERFHAVYRTSRAVPLIIPVNCETFLAAATEREYLRLLGSVPAPYLERIVIELVGVGENITIQQIQVLTERIRRHVDKVIVEVPVASPLLPMFSRGQAFGLGCNLAGASDRDAQTLSRFVEVARDVRALTFAHSANTLGLAGAAIEAGFQHVDGSAVHLNTTEPRPSFRLKPMTKLDPPEVAARLSTARSAFAGRTP